MAENEELRLTVSVDDQATTKLVGGEESLAATRRRAQLAP